MYIESIALKGYRNYTSVSLFPKKGITVLYGQNGAGKTNILEAIHLCCLGKSHRTSFDRELIQYEQAYGTVHIKARLKDGLHDVKILLQKKEKKSKEIFIYGKKVQKIGELMGHIHCVIFSPEDLQMIKEGPSLRRKFIDMQLSQMRPTYFYALQKYTAILNQRNSLLREGNKKKQRVQDELLDIWDEQLALHGKMIIDHRRWFVEKLKEKTKETYFFISGNQDEELNIQLKTPFQSEEKIYEQMKEGLRKGREEDRKYGQTGFGPHRDDLAFTLSGKEVKTYGSQGQIRTVALCIKLAQLEMMKEDRSGDAPILLLDDVMSELDPFRRKRLLEKIEGIQTFITCTDKSDLHLAKVESFIQVQKDEKGIALIKEEEEIAFDQETKE
ncbi:MAG: DNA replication/repair protein RecF [Clostridiales bacterium]|nr:DNA replication/repair protein RecF [Clostridiales bacterium]